MNPQTPDTSDRLATFPTLEAVRGRLDAIGLDDAGRAAAEPADGAAPREALLVAARILERTGRADDAVSVLGQALSRRAAVWWACQAARGEDGGVLAAESAPLEIAERWVRRPEQGTAYAAYDLAMTAGLGHPAGCAAMCAFLAGESLAPAHLPPLPPADHLAGMLAAGAVKIAAVRRDPSHADAAKARLLEVGHAIAAGTDTWEEG